MTPLGNVLRHAECEKEEPSTQQLTRQDLRTAVGGEQWQVSHISTTRATQPGGINHEVIFITADSFISLLNENLQKHRSEPPHAKTQDQRGLATRLSHPQTVNSCLSEFLQLKDSKWASREIQRPPSPLPLICLGLEPATSAEC